jgi:hypothetical protein
LLRKTQELNATFLSVLVSRFAGEPAGFDCFPLFQASDIEMETSSALQFFVSAQTHGSKSGAE